MKRGWIEYRNLKTPKTDLEIILAKDLLCTFAAPAWFSLYKELCHLCVCMCICVCVSVQDCVINTLLGGEKKKKRKLSIEE